MIEVNNVSYFYPSNQALKQVSFKIEANTITALVGPNGAGKTTLMRCLAGLDTPFEGELYVNGIDVLEEPRLVHRNVGYLPDTYGLYEELTAYQSLYYHAEAQDIAVEQRDTIINDLAERLGLSQQLKKQAGSLSRGQRQRLGIAQAMIHRPKILILDEPASGLDPEAREDLSKLLLNLQQQDMTILVSSHILSELESYSSHMMILQQGAMIDHSPIGKTEQQDSVLIRIKLTSVNSNMVETLQQYPDIKDVSTETEQSYLCTLEGDEQVEYSLLKYLIDNDYSVCSFSQVQRSMHHVYLERVRGEQ